MKSEEKRSFLLKDKRDKHIICGAPIPNSFLCILSSKHSCPCCVNETSLIPDMGTVTFLLYNNKMSWWRPWSMLLPWYHPYQRRHMKSKSLNPGQMNTNLVYWHETGSFWYRPSWTILIWTPKNKSGCFCVDETLQVATIRTQHPFFLYKLKYRKSQSSSVDDVNRCVHVFTSTRVLVCVPATAPKTHLTNAYLISNGI